MNPSFEAFYSSSGHLESTRAGPGAAEGGRRPAPDDRGSLFRYPQQTDGVGLGRFGWREHGVCGADNLPTAPPASPEAGVFEVPTREHVGDEVVQRDGHEEPVQTWLPAASRPAPAPRVRTPSSGALRTPPPNRVSWLSSRPGHRCPQGARARGGPRSSGRSRDGVSLSPGPVRRCSEQSLSPCSWGFARPRDRK